MKPRQIAAFGLKHQLVIHLMSPRNVSGGIKMGYEIRLFEHPNQLF